MAKEDHQAWKPTAKGSSWIERVRQKYIELDALLDEASDDYTLAPGVALASSGRALAVAKTHLETSRMWAVQFIVRIHNEGPHDQGQLSGAANAIDEDGHAAAGTSLPLVGTEDAARENGELTDDEAAA